MFKNSLTFLVTTDTGYERSYVFGGSQKQNNNNILTNQLLVFDESKLVKEYKKFDKIQIQPRAFHSTIYYKESLFVFGGKANEHTNAVHEFHTRAETWKEIPTNEDAEKPTPRYGHTAQMHNHIMYVFGGYDSNGSCDNYLYRFHLKESKWISKVCMPSIPPRFHHTMNVTDTNMLIIFGGKNEQGRLYNDLHAITLDDLTAFSISPMGDIAPRPRYGHVSQFSHGVLYIQGGTNDARDFYDVWSFWIHKCTWNKRDANPDLERGAVFAAILYGEYHGGVKIADANISPIDAKYVVENILLDMIPSILSYLDKSDLTALACVSKNCKIAALSSINALWKEHYEQGTKRIEMYKQKYEKELAELLQGADDSLGTHYKRAIVYLCSQMNQYHTEPQFCQKAEQLVQEARRQYIIALPTFTQDEMYTRTPPQFSVQGSVTILVLGDRGTGKV